VVIVSYNGSGTFNINTAGQPVVTGTVISSTAFNALTADLATGLSTAITKDGQTAATARIPFAQGISSTLVTDSTSTTTGSIITAGGVGVAKALFVGTTANVAGAVTLQSTLGVTGITTFSAQPIFSSLTASSAVATDASKGLVSVTNTGTGNNVLATSPTLVTPVLGAASATSVTVDAGAVGTPSITTAGDTNTGIFFPAADTIAFSEGGAEAMRITSTGDVGIGTSSPSYKLDVSGNGRVTGDLYVGVSTNIIYESGSNLNIRAANSLLFLTSGANERARIDSSGNLLVGTTSQINTGLICAEGNLNSVNTLVCKNANTQAPGQAFVFFANSAGNKAGSIDHTGTTTVAYTTSSDYRMKENIAPMTGALIAVSQLKPCTYTWKEDGKAGQGFIAHELQAVVPDCVSGEKDAVEEEQYEVTPAVKDEEGNTITEAVMGTRIVPSYQGIDTSFLVATLTAAIQELKAVVDAQAARITALEAA
jgi:hypothetical protein